MSHSLYKTTYVRPNKTADIAVRHVVVAAPASPMPRKKAKQNSGASLGTFFAALILMFGAYSLANASSTVSYFADTERSVANVLQAMGVGLRVDDDKEIFVSPGGIGVFPSQVALEDESGPLQYRIFAEQSNNQALESVTAFCEALTASTTSAFLPYTGPLLSLATGTTTEMGDWSYDVTFSEDAPGIIDGDTCKLDMVYRAWSLGAQEGTGYQDEERFSVIVHAVVADARVQEEQQFAPLAFVALFAEDTATSTTATSTEETEEETPKEDNDGGSNNAPLQSGGGGVPPVDPDPDDETLDDKKDDKDTEKSDTATTTEEVQEESDTATTTDEVADEEDESSDEEVVSFSQEIVTDEEVDETIVDEGDSGDEQEQEQEGETESVQEETPPADDETNTPEATDDTPQEQALPPEPQPLEDQAPGE